MSDLTKVKYALNVSGVGYEELLKKFGLSEKDMENPSGIVKLIEGVAGMSEDDIREQANLGSFGRDIRYKKMKQGVRRAKALLITDATNLLTSQQKSYDLRNTTNKMIDSLVGAAIGGSSWLLEKGLSNDPSELFGVGEGSIEAAVKKMEDERLPGHALDLAGQTAGNTGETAKNTRKANQIQLAILKQVAGTRVVNRVVHVNPNIVSHVGTIRNGIEYDQLLKDLGSTVNHAVTAYAL